MFKHFFKFFRSYRWWNFDTRKRLGTSTESNQRRISIQFETYKIAQKFIFKRYFILSKTVNKYCIINNLKLVHSSLKFICWENILFLCGDKMINFEKNNLRNDLLMLKNITKTSYKHSFKPKCSNYFYKTQNDYQNTNCIVMYSFFYLSDSYIFLNITVDKITLVCTNCKIKKRIPHI